MAHGCNKPFVAERYGMDVKVGSSSSASALFARGQSAARVRKKDVFELIDRNLGTLDRDGNGTVSWNEMRRGIANPEFQGENAAAVATLYSLIQDKGIELGRVHNPPLTAGLYEEMREERDWALEEGDKAAADLYYDRYLNKLEKASDELFPQGMPDGLAVRQGFGPSCAILSTTVGQALLDPQRIKDAVTERPDGKVSVKFPGLARAIVVPAATDTETALFATAGKNGSWLNHIEKAWGTTQTSDRLAAFEKSSWPAKSIRAWTHGQATTETVPKKLISYHKGEMPSFMKNLSEGLKKGRIVMTWTRNGERQLDGLVSGHAHTVMGYNADQGTLTVRNPWGRQEPTGDNGKPRDGEDDGVFELSLEEYVRDFGRIALQTSEARPGK